MMTPNDIAPPAEPSVEGRPAAEWLAARGATAEWEQRAEWLEIEAKAQRDPAARARLLLAASEVRALLGARADARRLALQAANHQPPPAFAARQARALHQTHGDVSALARSLAEEAHVGASSELTAHALCLSAMVQRHLQRDPAAARASLEAAEGMHPGHARASLERLLLELSLGQAPPRVPLPAGDDWEPLRRAVDVIRRLRGEPGVATGPEFVDAVALVEVQDALVRNDLAAAAEALAPLAAHGGLLPAVRWLAAAWRTAAAPDAEAALGPARALAREQPCRAARRALAARALRAGRWDALQEALAEPAADHEPAAFSNVERAALSALLGRSVEPEEAAAAEAPALTSIAAAVSRASSAPPSATPTTASSEDDAEFRIGRAAASLAALSDADVDGSASPWALALRLERARALGDWPELARELPGLLETPGAVAESSFVAAVFAERAGDLGAARELLQASLPSASTREAATRALTERGADGAALLRALSARTSDPQRRALLLTEAAFRLEPSAPEFDAITEEATRLYPALPFAVELGDAAATARGDRPRAARWLARRRELAQGADDVTLAALREALSPSLDQAVAAERWQELLARHPDDLPLVLAAERHLERPARDRAAFRKRMAPLLGARGRQRFLAEAIECYEAAGDRSAAFALTRELGGVLAELWLPRLASTPEELDALAQGWLYSAQRAPSSELAAELYEQLATLERRRGQPERALAWERARLAHEPDSLEALRALEIASMAPGRNDDAELARSAAALFERLGERDGAGYAFLAARIEIARGAFDAALPFARRMRAASVPPLWALRLDAIHARASGDDQALLVSCRALRERSSQALDAATLSLHAAEAALRLGESHLAKEEIERASELAPDDIVILSVRAEVLRENGDYAEAAEAFETLASATSSKRRQVEALYQAAVLWLDQLQHRARGVLALQEAASVDVPHSGVLERLVALGAQSDDLDGIAELVERQRARLSEAAVDVGAEAIALEGPNADPDAERAPDDDDAIEQRVARHTRNEDWAEAVLEQRLLLERAQGEVERRARMLHLVKLLDQLPTGASEAESLLEQARRTWPDDLRVLEAEIDHYIALGHPGTAHLVAERAAQGARAAIAAGRLEAAPFRALETATRLAADPDSALAARAMARAIAGGPSEDVRGAGARAGDVDLDELLAPPPLTAELRRVLYLAGSAIERAYALDPASSGARAAPDAVVARVRDVALGFGLERVRVLRSPDVGVDAIGLGMDPVCLVLGDALLERAEPAVEAFLVLRALKLARANASALARLSPLDGWAVLAGFLACFGPLTKASGTDAQRLISARNRIRPHVTWTPEAEPSDRMARLMADVLPHAAHLGGALCRWAARVALLGVGDPAIAFDALSGHDPRALSSEEARMRWIAGHPDARDLVSFGVSEAYIEARQRAGLGAAARPDPLSTSAP